MTGAQGIRLSKAFIEIFADPSKFEAGLRRAEAMLRGWAARVNLLGRTGTLGGSMIGAGFQNLLRGASAGLGGFIGYFGRLRQAGDAAARMIGRLGFTFMVFGFQLSMTGRAVTFFAQSMLRMASSVSRATASMLATGAQWGAQLYWLSRAFGINVSTMSKFQFAAEQSGTDTEHLVRAVRDLSARLTEAGKGAGTAQQAFADLGLDWKQLINMSPEDQMLAIADAIASVENPTTRAGLAMKIFGRYAEDLAPLLRHGNEGLRALFERADQLGITLDTKTARSLASLQQSFRAVWSIVRRVAAEMAETLEPAFRRMVNTVGLATKPILDWIRAHRQIVVGIAAVVAAFSAFAVALYAVGTAMKIAGSWFLWVSTAFQAVSSAIPLVLHAFGALASVLSTAWGFASGLGIALLGIAKIIAGSVLSLIGAFASALTVVLTVGAQLVGTLAMLGGFWAGLAGVIGVAAGSIWLMAQVLGSLDQILAAVGAGFRMAADGAVAVAGAIGRGLVGALQFAGQALQSVVAAVGDLLAAFSTVLPQIVNRWAVAFDEMWKIAKDTVRGVYEAISAGDWQLAIDLMVNTFKLGWAEIKQVAIGTFLDVLRVSETIFEDLAVKAVELAATVRNAFLEAFDQVRTVVMRLIDEVVKAGVDMAQEFQETLVLMQYPHLMLYNERDRDAALARVAHRDVATARKGEIDKARINREAEMKQDADARRAPKDQAATKNAVSGFMRGLQDMLAGAGIKAAGQKDAALLEREKLEERVRIREQENAKERQARQEELERRGKDLVIADEQRKADVAGTFNVAAIFGLGGGGVFGRIDKNTAETAKNTKKKKNAEVVFV